jgi:hypothetical protein
MTYYKKWKQFLKEATLNEAAKGINDLTDNMYIKVADQGSGLTIELIDRSREKGKEVIGGINMFVYDLSDGNRVAVPHSGAEQGWGPFLYDITMQLATENLGVYLSPYETFTALHRIHDPEKESWRRPDTSEKAQAVWKYYYEKRDDVRRESITDVLFDMDINIRELSPDAKENIKNLPEELRYFYAWEGGDLIGELEDIGAVDYVK